MDLHEIKRNYYRITDKDNGAVAIKINKIPYQVIDISDSGIGILLSAEDILVAEGDQLPLELTIENKIQKVQGKVVHVNPSGPTGFFCGIQFLDIDEKTKAMILKYLQTRREKIFKEV